MEQNTAAMLITELKSWGRVWDSICLKVSASLVKWDITFPWEFLSKYPMGSVWRWENISSLISLRVAWETMPMVLLAKNMLITPAR